MIQGARVLLDADAFLAARSLALLDGIRAAPSRGITFTMCQFAARHELCSLDREIRELEAQGCLNIYAVDRRTAADRMYRELKQHGVDKGEAEAIAWAATLTSARPVFISADAGARRAAEGRGIVVGDVMDLVVLLIECGALSAEAARAKLSPWLEPEQQRGRPRDLVPFDFDAAYERRRSKWL